MFVDWLEENDNTNTSISNISGSNDATTNTDKFDTRVLPDKLSMMEFAEVLGDRINQINDGSPVYVDIPGADVETIAIQEIIQKKSPLSLSKEVGPGVPPEIWPINQLIFDMKELVQ